MPPLPPTFSEDAVQLVESLERRYKDVENYQISRLRDCIGPISVQQELAAELREDLDALSTQHENLSTLVLDQQGERNRKALKSVVDEHSERLTRLRRDYRSALLASKRAIDAQGASNNRAELFKSSAPAEKRDPNEKATDDLLMKTNSDITETLRRTIGLMQNELERSVLSTQMLESSTATLQSTSSTHDMLTNFLGTSKQLVTALEKSDWLDRLILMAAMLFFFIVCLFILKERVLDRGIRLAMWWTRFIPDFSGDQDLLRNAEYQPMKSVQQATAAAAITASTLSSLVSASISSVASAATAISNAGSTETYATLSPVLEDILSTTSTTASDHPPEPTETDSPQVRPQDEL